MSDHSAEGTAPEATAELPPGEAAALRRVRAVATVLDESVRVPGTRFRVGLDPLLGLMPVSGDLLAAALSLYIVVEAVRLGAPKRTVARMLLNVGVDAAVGSIPLFGDLFDAYWKANARNVDLLERHVERRSGPSDRAEGTAHWR